MPANRPHLNRDAKADEILNAAETLLLRDGYDATKMAAIASRAGVATNAVYWYFPSKDDLLAAVLRRRQEQAFVDLPDPVTTNLPDQVVALLAKLDEVATLTTTVHERATHSGSVAAMHQAFHDAVDRRLQEGFRAAGLGERDARQASSAITAMVEGIHLHQDDRDPATRNELMLWTLQRFLDGAPSE